MRAKITRWWKSAKKFIARFGHAMAWAAIAAFLRAIFGSLIDTLGWGPLIALIVTTGGVAFITALAGAPWYWVVGPSFLIGAFFLLQSVRAAAELTKQRRLEKKGERDATPKSGSSLRAVSDHDLQIVFSPVDFAQDTPPFAQIQYFRLSDLDPFMKEMIEIERSLPPAIRPQPNDGLFLFMLFRIGIQNQTSRTIKRTRCLVPESDGLDFF